MTLTIEKKLPGPDHYTASDTINLDLVFQNGVINSRQ